MPSNALVPRDRFEGISQYALNEIYAVKVVFERWVAELDSPAGESNLFINTRNLLNKLHESSEDAFTASVDIVQCHESFAKMMVNRLEMTLADPQGIVRYDWRAMKISEDIKARSSELSAHISKMIEELKLFVDSIRDLDREDRANSWGEMFLGWVVGLLRSLKRITSTLRLGTFSSFLGNVIQRLEDDGLENLINFLQNDVPRAARRAERMLVSCQNSQGVLQYETEVLMQSTKGTPVRVEQGTARAALAEWREEEQRLGGITIPGGLQTSGDEML